MSNDIIIELNTHEKIPYAFGPGEGVLPTLTTTLRLERSKSEAIRICKALVQRQARAGYTLATLYYKDHPPRDFYADVYVYNGRDRKHEQEERRELTGTYLNFDH